MGGDCRPQQRKAKKPLKNGKTALILLFQRVRQDSRISENYNLFLLRSSIKIGDTCPFFAGYHFLVGPN